MYALDNHMLVSANPLFTGMRIKPAGYEFNYANKNAAEWMHLLNGGRC